jgi:protein gp37
MSEKTKIQWCDHTFNPWIGCAKVSPGCENCYAEVSTPSRAMGIKWGKGQPRQRTSASNWREPIKWNRHAWICDACGMFHTANADCEGVRGHRPRVFCASLADWLDDEVPIEWLTDLLKLIHDTPNLDWLLLTKRPQNWRTRIEKAMHQMELTSGDWLHGWLNDEPPATVWIGTTTEDQQRADERIPELLKIPARVRFLSVEPMLGPVDLDLVEDGRESEHEKSWAKPTERGCGIDWVIVGGESGSKSRPCNVDWIRSVVRQCQAAGVPCFVKQLGARPIETLCEGLNARGTPCGGREVEAENRVTATAELKFQHPKGGDMAEWPEDLRVREFPEVRA